MIGKKDRQRGHFVLKGRERAIQRRVHRLDPLSIQTGDGDVKRFAAVARCGLVAFFDSPSQTWMLPRSVRAMGMSH